MRLNELKRKYKCVNVLDRSEEEGNVCINIYIIEYIYEGAKKKKKDRFECSRY